MPLQPILSVHAVTFVFNDPGTLTDQSRALSNACLSPSLLYLLFPQCKRWQGEIPREWPILYYICSLVSFGKLLFPSRQGGGEWLGIIWPEGPVDTFCPSDFGDRGFSINVKRIPWKSREWGLIFRSDGSNTSRIINQIFALHLIPPRYCENWNTAGTIQARFTGVSQNQTENL